MIVVSDTSPLNYLVLIQHAEVLPSLFGRDSSPALIRTLALAPAITLRGPATCGNIGLNGQNDYSETRHVNSYHRGTRGQIGGVGG
jgi:hypothetical protein